MKGPHSWHERLERYLQFCYFDEPFIYATAMNGDIGQTSTPRDTLTAEVEKYLQYSSVVGEFQEPQNSLASNSGRSVSNNDSASSCGIITLIRGLPTPYTIMELEEKFNIDPEHLLSHYYPLRSFRILSLPSHPVPMAIVRLASLGRFCQPISPQKRIKKTNSMVEFLSRRFTFGKITDAAPGVERFRNIKIHDDKIFTVEQQVAFFTYQDNTKETWSGVLLMDIGRPRPSRLQMSTESDVKVKFYPLATNGIKLRTESGCEQELDPFVSRAKGDLHIMSEDHRMLCARFPIAFLVDLLNTSAMSWSQTFSYLRASYDMFLSSHCEEVDRLRVDKKFLDRAISYFKETIALLSQPPEGWTEGTQCDQIISCCQDDFKALLYEADHLSKRCSEYITVAMSTMSIMESKKSLEEARRVQFVTYLAFIFIPMTFIASCFGMNIQELKDPGSTLGVFMTISIPFTAIAIAVPAWIEWNAEIKRRWTRIWVILRIKRLLIRDKLRAHTRPR
ncbi:hypothetical protein DM02DRAFT_678916 [Periconia macrospinosa]|uniref:Cora-domain-containing protein n=1 Tax=Periconia macrospinosa TaxID=97972 RepID=A0A2V1ECQ4_9PLEO|nr:hypothetical protein DM02DRAFT_678916 [Periconia macrospinosa]